MVFDVSARREMNSRAKTSYHQSSSSCTNGWYTTGYFTPVESDYKSIRTKTVNVQGYGSVTLNKAFLKQVTIEGFGKTKEGWYISCSPETPHWYITKAPLDELDNELVSGQNCCCRLQSYTF